MGKINNNKNGFVLIETIIVISILALGLLSLYSSYVLIARNANNNKNDVLATYVAYQVYNYNNRSNDEYNYVELYWNSANNRYEYRSCKATCTSGEAIPSEEAAIYKNLNIEKIYYIGSNFNDIFSDNILINFDGSTIDYLQNIKNDDSIDSSANYSIIVKLNSSKGTSFSIYQSFYQIPEAPTCRLLNSAVLSQGYDNKSNYTVPGRQTATNDEGLRTTEDDYGTSYYYRGAIENNYVVFANMCWRIVRIDGQGNTKLVLYNNNSDNSVAENPCNVKGGYLAFIKVSEDISPGLRYGGMFNTPDYKNTYVGYMYSNTPDSNNYLESHANDKDSIILSRLKTWYDANLSAAQQNLLADTIWCNDKRVADIKYQPGNAWGAYPNRYANTGISNQITAYAAHKRIAAANDAGYASPATLAAPSLKCGESKEDNKISKFTAEDTTYGNAKLNTTTGGVTKYYKIGLLTADEVAFAGSMSGGTGNKFYYLYGNAYGNVSYSFWWTMTPTEFFNNVAKMFIVNGSGYIYIAYDVSNQSGFTRPAISLKSTACIASDGDGTAANPYVIEES